MITTTSTSTSLTSRSTTSTALIRTQPKVHPLFHYDSVSSSSSSSSPLTLLFSSSTNNNEAAAAAAAATDARTSASTSMSSTLTSSSLNPDQLRFVLGYMNKHHVTVLQKWAEAFSTLGSQMAKANAWSGGSFAILAAQLVHVDTNTVTLQVTCMKRGQANNFTETVSFDISNNPQPVGERRRYYDTAPDVPVDPSRLPIDDVVRKLCRLCWMVKEPAVTGQLLQMALQLGGAGIGQLPENMFLNQVPHNRYVRQYFYNAAADAVQQAVTLCAAQQHTNRMKVVAQFPEMNPSMDAYRIGTILEMTRAMAIRLAEQNLRVRVCVQGSMGVGIFTGVPKQLSGVSKLVQLMDWQSGVGEENEGMVGTYVRFGAVGPEHVMNTVTDGEGNIIQHQDDVFLIIAPQSMVGTDSSIYPFLSAMVEAAGDRPVILINPDLTDKVSAAGQQSVRGRKERMEFANSFETIYQFQNIYVSGTSYFPILGAISKRAPTEPYVALQRRDYALSETEPGEIYVPMLASETLPQGSDIMTTFEMS